MSFAGSCISGYIENCTVGELNDALKYAGKTKDGLFYLIFL